MCTDHESGQAHDPDAGVSAAMPRPVEGDAVHPIALEPVDEVVVTTLVDNSYDGLLVDMGPAQRRPMPRTPVRAAAPVLEPTVVALTDLAPDVIVPAHCTGWRAQHRLASALPAAFVPNAVGTTFVLPAT